MQPLLSDLTVRHLARVVESSDDAIVSKDLNGIILSWNRAAERIFGYTAAEAVGQSIRMIIPPDRQSEEDTVLERIRSGLSVTHFETLRQRKNGELVPISLTVSPIYDDHGVVIGASKIARDLSDHVRGQLASRRLNAIVNSSDDAIISKTLDGVITSWNAAAERMFGYTEHEAIGRSIRMLIPADLQGEEDVVLAKIRAGDKVDHYETIRQHKDGTSLRISLTVSPIRNDLGEIVGASKIARDITERSRLQALANEHAANTQKLGEIGAIVASTLERHKILQKVTDIATELTRAELGAFFYNVTDPETGERNMLHTISGAPRDAFGDSSAARTTALFAPILRGEGPIRVDDVTREPRYGQHSAFFGAATDRLAIRSFLGVPVRGLGGDVFGGLFFGHSEAGVFTEQHARLASGIAAWASVALENARLYADAQQANRMKDEFLAVLSHELRTPLNAIVGYVRLLRGGILSGEKAARGLETLERNALWLSQIVEDVLDVSRIIAGKIRLDVQPVELPLIVDNAVATVQPAADARGVRVQTVIDPRVGPVSGDPGRLQQVVWNLVSNAVKFTGKNGRVQVRLERVNSHIEIVVSDTGIGIPADFLPYVFERFRQAEAGTTRKTGGLGLGLAIVRHIIEMHGGTVEAASPGEGKGATFRVRLPLMIVHPDAREPRREHPRTERVAPLTGLADLRGIRIVAIDDEHDALTLLRVVLESAGAHVATISDPTEAIACIEKIKPQVIVVDLGMPAIDGFELITRIRADSNPDVSDVPAVALTAFARSEDRTRALRAGFQGHLAKPIEPVELVAAIASFRSVIDNQRGLR